MGKNSTIFFLYVVLTSTMACRHTAVKKGESDQRIISEVLRCREEFGSVLGYVFEDRTNDKAVGLILKVSPQICQDTLSFYLKGCLYPMNIDTMFSIWGIRPNKLHQDRYRFFCSTSEKDVMKNPKSKEYVNQLFLRIDTVNRTVIDVRIRVDSAFDTQIISCPPIKSHSHEKR